MNKLTLLAALLLSAAPLSAQQSSPTRSVTASTLIADDYYGKFISVPDSESLESNEVGSLDQAVEADSALAGSQTYADASQWSWIDSLGGDFESEGLAAGGLYNQYNGEMWSESRFQADFVVESSGSVSFSYELWFGNTFGGLTGQARAGLSLAEVRLEDSLGTPIFWISSSLEGGELSGQTTIPLGPGQYRFLARAEVTDSTFFETVVGSMTVANFYVEGTFLGTKQLSDPPTPDMRVASLDLNSREFAARAGATATVSIVDGNGQPIPFALVSGTFSGSSTGSFAGLTDQSGKVTFLCGPKRVRRHAFTFCVDDVTHATLSYDSSLNVTSCASTP